MTHPPTVAITPAVYILSIDLGTSGPKVALVSDQGDLAASAARSVGTVSVPPQGFEQDPEEIWAAIVSATRQVIAEAGVAREEIVGIACDSQYFSVLPVDRDARALMNLIIWMDTRGGTYSRGLYERHPSAFEVWSERHGMVPLPSGNDSLSHMLFVQHERPDIYEKAFKFLEPVDYVTARLTGACVSNLCTAFPLLLTDNRDLGAPRYDSELVALAGIDRDKLPDLAPIGSCLGTLLPAVAGELGLSPQTKVFAGVNDTQAVSIGAGTFRGALGGLNIGTTGQVLAHVDGKRSDFENEIISMPSPIAGRYLVMAENGLGAKTLDFFLRQIAFARDALADHSSADPFAGVDAEVADSAAGSGGVLFLPWLTGSGAPKGNAQMRGGFLNLSLQTTRADMVRSILEGVAFNLRWLLPAVEKFVGADFDELTFSGGGAVSDAWSQVMADVMGRPVAQLADARHVNNRATAFLAFVEMGVLGLDDIGKLCRVKRRYEPRPALRSVYDGHFAQFLAAFERNQPIFEALNK